jgi:hypothetical protein
VAKDTPKSDLAAMLDKSEQEREMLAKERDAITAKINRCDMMIEALRAVLAPLPKEAPVVGEVAVAMLKHAGLTDVVRMTLQASAHQGYITITQIIDKLKSVSYPLGRLDNPRATIVVVLSRMVSAGDVEKADIGRPEPAFRWIKEEKMTIGALMQGIKKGEKPMHKRMAKAMAGLPAPDLPPFAPLASPIKRLEPPLTEEQHSKQEKGKKK